MKVGDYARTCYGTIFKIENITEIDVDGEYFKSKLKKNSVIKDLPNFMYAEGEILNKTSPNIIDLIEVHDVLKLFDKEYGLEYKVEVLLNEEGYKYISNYECSDLLNLEWELMSGEHVKILSIVTKEQFESMEYKIGE